MLGSRAAFHDGFGCVTVCTDRQALSAQERHRRVEDCRKLRRCCRRLPARPWSNRPIPRLKAALDHAFEEPAEPPFRRTKAVVVVQDGKVIAERYADGIGVDTPLLGFSMTKSVINALIGMLTQQGLVTPSMTAPIAEWRGADDPRREIEVEHLMRMTTGLALDETNSGFDPSSQMVYLHDDMAGFAVKAAMIAPPGTRWAYSSPTTQLLARIIRDAVGGPEQTLAFAWRELFNPLGMRNVTLEFDGERHAAGLVLHAGQRAGLGALRAALSERRRWSATTASCTKTGWIFQPPRRSTPTTAPASGPIAASTRTPRAASARHSARRVLCVRRSRPAHRHPAVAASGDRPSRRFRRSHRRHPRSRAAGQGGDRGGGSIASTPARRSRSAQPAHRIRSALFQRAVIGRAGVNALEKRHRLRDGPDRARRARRRLPAESSSGYRRR